MLRGPARVTFNDVVRPGNTPSVANCRNLSRKERPMKVRKSLRSLKNKPGAQVVRRHGKVYVITKKDPRFKARQG